MADPIWQSACKECFPRCGYKGARFENCERRIERLKEIGGLAEPAPIKLVRGGNMSEKNPKILGPVTLDRITKAAKVLCKVYGIDYKRELMTKLKDKKVTQARRHIIVVLSKKPHSLTNGQIGKYLSLSQQYISHVINHHQYVMSSQSGELTEPLGENASLRLAIDFNGKEDLLGIVKQLAAKELRPVHLQLLHMVQAQAKLLYEEHELDKDEDNYSRTFSF